MILDNIVTIGTLAASAIAIYLSLRKQKHEGHNTDADTIEQMFQNFKEQEERYKNLKIEFDEYKQSMNEKFAEIASENVKLRAWARRLVYQLEQANIVPTKYMD